MDSQKVLEFALEVMNQALLRELWSNANHISMFESSSVVICWSWSRSKYGFLCRSFYSFDSGK